MLRRRWLPAVVLLALVLLLVVPSAAVYYTDWLWYRELGYEGLFLRALNAQGAVFLATFVLVYLFVYLNFRVARSALRRPLIVFGPGRDGRPLTVQTGQITGWTGPAAAILALMFAISGAANWLAWLSFFNAAPFGDRDPLFGRDIGFYVFRLPIWQSIREQALVASFLALIGCGLIYVLSGSFVIEPRGGSVAWPRFRLAPTARRHLALLAALVFGLMAWGAWLATFQTLLTQANVIFGASYVDVHATLPFLWISVVVLALGAVLAIWRGFGGRGWAIPLGVASYLAVSVAGGLYAALIQGFVVDPNESTKEQPYIRNNIAATRRAYALDRVDERELSGDAALTPQQIAANASTIENVRLWDHDQLLADVRADPGDSHLLRLRLGGQRPLHGRRQGAAGDALGPRAQHRPAAEPELRQRAADLHARLRPDARTGQPGDDRRLASAVRAEPAAAGRAAWT